MFSFNKNPFTKSEYSIISFLLAQELEQTHKTLKEEISNDNKNYSKLRHMVIGRYMDDIKQLQSKLEEMVK